jgi:phosphoribosyl 1,2-cyclic phosphodiesterase
MIIRYTKLPMCIISKKNRWYLMCEIMGDFRIRFWGTRGSIPAPGPGTVKYGGNTSCIEVRCGQEIIVLDAGTGIRELGNELTKENPSKISILFSHVHWDHIQGMPFFQPASINDCHIRLYGNLTWKTKLEQSLKLQMKSPNFPTTLERKYNNGKNMKYIDIDGESRFNIGQNKQISIQSFKLRHPNDAFGFRIEYNGKSMVYATDTESLPTLDDKLIGVSGSTDLLIHDAQYTRREYYGFDGSSKKNWGHSTPEAAAKIAQASKVKKLVLFHHDPYHHDLQIDEMVKSASEIFPNTIAAYEGMAINLTNDIMVLNESYSGEICKSTLYSLTAEAAS